MKDKAAEEWLNAQKKTTKATYKTFWKYFRKFTGLTGDEVLESHKSDHHKEEREYLWEKKVLEFKGWILKNTDLSEKTATAAANAVRGFFSFYRLPLQFRRSESAKISEARRKTEDYRFSIADLKKMSDVANLKEKYVIIAGKSFGLRAGDFMALTRGDLEPYIDREPPISIGEYATQKENVSAFPFIDTDARSIIKLMLERMDRIGKIKPTDRILDFKNIIELSRVLQRVTERAGITIGNKRVRFHCLRKFLTDHLSSYMSESKWKQIVGKKINEGAYVSPDTLRDDYGRAMSETCFGKRVEGKDVEQIARQEALMAIARSMGFRDQQIRDTFKIRKAKHISRKIKELERLIQGKKDNANNSEDCPDGEHCARQKVVSEAELTDYLKQGWRATMTLPSGKIVIER